MDFNFKEYINEEFDLSERSWGIYDFMKRNFPAKQQISQSDTPTGLIYKKPGEHGIKDKVFNWMKRNFPAQQQIPQSDTSTTDTKSDIGFRYRRPGETNTPDLSVPTAYTDERDQIKPDAKNSIQISVGIIKDILTKYYPNLDQRGSFLHRVINVILKKHGEHTFGNNQRYAIAQPVKKENLQNEGMDEFGWAPGLVGIKFGDKYYKHPEIGDRVFRSAIAKMSGNQVQVIGQTKRMYFNIGEKLFAGIIKKVSETAEIFGVTAIEDKSQLELAYQQLSKLRFRKNDDLSKLKIDIRHAGLDVSQIPEEPVVDQRQQDKIKLNDAIRNLSIELAGFDPAKLKVVIKYMMDSILSHSKMVPKFNHYVRKKNTP